MNTPPRKIGGAPFTWQDKRMLRRIREQCEEPASALAVYVALTVVSSDNEKEEFQTTHGWLASLSGFCEKTVRSRLADLERIQAVHVTTPPMKAPCTYRLLPFGNDYRTSGNGCRTFGKIIPSALPTSEEVEERRKKIQKPCSIPERIAAENRLRILKGRFEELAADTSEQWQRDENPSLVNQKAQLKSEITALENSLL